MMSLRERSPLLYKIALVGSINLILGMITAALLYVAYLMWWPVEPKIFGISSRVITPVVAPNGPLAVHRVYRVTEPILVMISRQIRQVDGPNIYILNPVQRIFTPDDGEAIPHIVLPGLPDGRYRYDATVSYRENILRTTVVRSESVFFLVREP